MEWSELFNELVELVKTAAPALWAIARRQVYAEAVGEIFAALAFGAITYVCLCMFRWFKSKAVDPKKDCYDRDGWWVGTVCSAIAAGGFFFGVLIPLCNAIKYLINVDYYAIQILIGLVTP